MPQQVLARLRICCWLAFCLFVLGCGATPTQPSRPAVTSPYANKDKDKTPGGNSPGLSDRSLASLEYIQLGMPAPDRPWTGIDMIRAFQALQPLAAQDPRQLPRMNSPKSGKVFARIVSTDNLVLPRDRTLPVEERMKDTLGLLQASNEITKLYLGGFSSNALSGSELTELTGLQLRLSALLVELVDEFTPNLDKKDPTYQVRLQGLARMKSGLATMIAGSLLTLRDSQVPTEELIRLIGYMKETFPTIIVQIAPGSQTETVVQLEDLHKSAKNKDHQPHLEELLELVRTALKKAAGR